MTLEAHDGSGADADEALPPEPASTTAVEAVAAPPLAFAPPAAAAATPVPRTACVDTRRLGPDE